MFENKKCKSCGEKIKDGWDFCPFCGEETSDKESFGEGIFDVIYLQPVATHHCQCPNT